MMMVMMVMMVMIWGPWWGPFTPVRPPGRVVYACSAYSLANRRKWDCGTTYTFIRPTLYLHTRIHDGRVCVCQLTVAVNSNWQHNDLCLAAITTQRNAANQWPHAGHSAHRQETQQYITYTPCYLRARYDSEAGIVYVLSVCLYVCLFAQNWKTTDQRLCNIYLYFTKSMVVIVRIEETNRQTTRRINKQKLNYGIYWQNSLNIHFIRSGSLFPQITRHVKKKQYWQYLTISISLVLNSFINKKLIRRWDSERGLSSRRHRTRSTKYTRLLHKFRHRSTRLFVGTQVYQIHWNNAM